MSAFVDTVEQKEQLDAVLSDLKVVKGSLMIAMQKAQEIYGYLPKEIQERIAENLSFPLEKVYGIATFYSQFHIHKPGKYKVGICMGTACYVRGADLLLKRVEEITGILAGQTSENGLYTVEATRCIGCCGLAPLITVGEEVFGNINADDVNRIMENYKE
ncbi:MAG: NAD(P)H-dependent oxidoreductase subunit E [Firmicutes bacterium]|nr:NAD(P)H-dependent oxidoreductase subunit E [Bacillota bacterium]